MKKNNLKFSIIMPTYNDCDMIEESLLSVINQDYDNWELIIVDDGSTDDTKNTISMFKKKYDRNNKIKYLYQENRDQLNAIKRGVNYISGDYVYIFHSDDLLTDDVLSNANEFLINNNYDAIISDLIQIDKNSNETGIIKVDEFNKCRSLFAEQLLWLGRNLYCDFGFYKKSIFLNEVMNNYLTWNGPFWLNLDDCSTLNVKKVDFPFYKYRVYGENYINNSLGKLCVLNGEIRVVTRLLEKIYIPFYNIQFFLYRLFLKIGIKKYYKIFYFNRETNNKSKVIDFVLKKRFSLEEIKNNIYLNSLRLFYKNYRDRSVYINEISKDEFIYYGSDLRSFNKNILSNSLSDFYLNLMDEMRKGFNKIVVKDKKSKDIMINVTKFLSIYPYVEVIVEK